ncbi:efflux RND transporter permease subunit [bacterium]|nr:efflux RND transporter permease subunit [bacterium]
MHNLIHYFLKRPALVNAMMLAVLFGSVLAWQKIGKEEMPEFAFNSLRITVTYPGASADDIELFITKPIEEKLKGVSALEEVNASSSYAVSSIRVYFDANIPDLREKVQEVKDAVETVEFPREARDPVYRQFKSSEKAIIDIGIYLKDVEILSVKDRQKLQAYVLSFKNRLLSLAQVSGVDSSGYLRPEIQIKIDPKKLQRYEISLEQVRQQILNQHVRYPIGSLMDKKETEINLDAQLMDIDSLSNAVINVGFEGQRLKLKDIAHVEEQFEKSNSVHKVQGKEGIILNVQKTTTSDILSAQKAIDTFVKQYIKNNPNLPVDFVFIDDESYDVKNRIDLISTNGLIGFILIVFFLFIFLDLRSGIWVAMGIPFSLGFTLIAALVLGFTINNMTLASIIIVLGIVVDDAIIVAENIVRHKGKNYKDGTVVSSTLQVASPVLASVLTTCAAFLPLYFFQGRFGMFVKYIPTIIILMLTASLIESFFILPGHIAHKSKLGSVLKKLKPAKAKHWRQIFLKRIESSYTKILYTALKFRFLLLLVFLGLLFLSGYIFKQHLRYVMFPREESKDFRVKVVASEPLKRMQMAKHVTQVEKIFLDEPDNGVTSVRTYIGQSWRGGEVRENEATVIVEIVPPSERNVSLNAMIDQWQQQTDKLKGFKEIRFMKSRFGFDSGSPIALEIQENNDELREKVAQELKKAMQELPAIENVEIEEPLQKDRYQLLLNKKRIDRLGIAYQDIASTLRTYVEGDILYTLNNGDEEVDVRLTGQDKSKDDIKKISRLTVANRENYLVPIASILDFKAEKKPSSIERVNYKRASKIYADIKAQSTVTPLEIARQIETKLIPKVLNNNPSTNIVFRGEVEESRESQADFLISVLMALTLIYLLLIWLFDSFLTPIVIAMIIPFGIVGTTLAFYLHGYAQYGFFAIVGTLGMMGVVINDAIVLIDKLKQAKIAKQKKLLNIAIISSSRLRAIVMTTITTVAGLFPTAYGLGGYDSMLAEMMLAMGWGLLFGMLITLFLVPCLYSYYQDFRYIVTGESKA